MMRQKVHDLTPDLALFYNPNNGQHSVRTLKQIANYSILHFFTAKECIKSPSHFSVQIDINKHIHFSPDYLKYINHSCNPNSFVDIHKNQIIAIKAIAENEEITFFYPSTEWQMKQPFNCFCGETHCLGLIQGAAYLSPLQLQPYQLNRHILVLSKQ